MRPGILAIVGVGLIGGSIGKAAKERRLAERVIGVEPNADSAQWAVENGVLDAVVSQVPDNADLIALCVPSDLVAQWVIKLADHTAPMFDVGSVKEPIVKEIELTRITPSQFVPCHPISGSEKSGPQAADGDLFDGCTVVLTPSINTGPMAQQACADFWQAMGAVVSMSPDEHDAALAVTSHLPHLLAFAFMGQVTDQHLPLTGGGFATLRALQQPIRISGGGSCSSIKGHCRRHWMTMRIIFASCPTPSRAVMKVVVWR